MRKKVSAAVGFVLGLIVAWYAPGLLRAGKRIEFSSDALENARQAIAHCDGAKAELGAVFVSDLTRVLRLIQSDPKQYETAGSTRSAILNRFPYAVEFSVAHDHVRITAVRHQPWRAGLQIGQGPK